MSLSYSARPRSYRDSFRQRSATKRYRQIPGRYQIHVSAEHFFELHLQCAEIKKCGTGQSVHQNVDVACGPLGTARDRPKNAQAVSFVPLRSVKHGGSLLTKRFVKRLAGRVHFRTIAQRIGATQTLVWLVLSRLNRLQRIPDQQLIAPLSRGVVMHGACNDEFVGLSLRDDLVEFCLNGGG